MMKLIDSLHKYDVSLFTKLLNAKSYHLQSAVARYISKTADGQLYLVWLLALYAYHGYATALINALLLAFLIERPIYFILKNSLKRNRPNMVLENFQSKITPSDQFSFPSGHTSAAFMVATLTGYFYPSWFIVLFIWAGLVGFSRVALGVHFPTDTLAGTALGICSAILSLEFIVV